MKEGLRIFAIAIAATLLYFAAMYGGLGLYSAMKCDKPGFVFRPLVPPHDNRC